MYSPMEDLLPQLKSFYNSTSFVDCIAGTTNEPFAKIATTLDLSFACLSLFIAKRTTNKVSQQLLVNKILKADVEAHAGQVVYTDEILNEMATKGDQLLGQLFPSQKSAIVGVVMNHAKIRVGTASMLVSVAAYLLLATIKKEARNRNWDNQEFPFFLYELKSMHSIAPQLNAKDIETLGVSSLFMKVRA